MILGRLEAQKVKNKKLSNCDCNNFIFVFNDTDLLLIAHDHDHEDDQEEDDFHNVLKANQIESVVQKDEIEFEEL